MNTLKAQHKNGFAQQTDNGQGTLNIEDSQIAQDQVTGIDF